MSSAIHLTVETHQLDTGHWRYAGPRFQSPATLLASQRALICSARLTTISRCERWLGSQNRRLRFRSPVGSRGTHTRLCCHYSEHARAARAQSDLLVGVLLRYERLERPASHGDRRPPRARAARRTQVAVLWPAGGYFDEFCSDSSTRSHSPTVVSALNLICIDAQMTERTRLTHRGRETIRSCCCPDRGWLLARRPRDVAGPTGGDDRCLRLAACRRISAPVLASAPSSGLHTRDAPVQSRQCGRGGGLGSGTQGLPPRALRERTVRSRQAGRSITRSSSAASSTSPP